MNTCWTSKRSKAFLLFPSKPKLERKNSFSFKVFLVFAFPISKRQCYCFLLEVRERGIVIFLSFSKVTLLVNVYFAPFSTFILVLSLYAVTLVSNRSWIIQCEIETHTKFGLWMCVHTDDCTSSTLLLLKFSMSDIALHISWLWLI